MTPLLVAAGAAVGVPLRLLLASALDRDRFPYGTLLVNVAGSFLLGLFVGLGVEQIDDAVSQGLETTDLVVHMPRAAASTLTRFVELLDLADEFCRQQRLLSLARTAEQREFQSWFLVEFVRQAKGGTPRSWLEARSDGHADVVS